MAKIIAIGPPVNDSERSAIARLKEKLPDSYTIIHNFEIRQGVEVFEIDLAILAPHSVFVVDVKGTRGQIDIYGSKWYPQGRQPYHSPLAKLRQHAKALKSLICEAYPHKNELKKIYVHAGVLMTASDASIVDPSGKDVPDIVFLSKCAAYFQSKTHIPSAYSTDIAPLHHLVQKAITGRALPMSSPESYRDWQVEEKLGGDDRYTEYRARHVFMGKSAGIARLRVYRVAPYQDAATRTAEKNRISNGFRAVAHMPSHSSILTVREFFEIEDADKLVLVTEDVSGQALRQHIKKPNLALTHDQKLGIMREVLIALDHAHKYQVIHRNLTPDAVLITADGHARLTSFDYARVGKDRSSSIAHEIVDDLDPLYQAPECYRDPTQASIASDLFSAGLVFYELLTGEYPFTSNEQMFDLDAQFPIKLSELRPDFPEKLDDWLQKLCAFDPEDRFPSAAVALRELMALITPKTQEAARLPAPTENLTDLPPDSFLAGRFVVQKRLGHGSFGVVYKVFDTFGDVVRVLKLITRDRLSIYERLRREYKILAKLPDHPHVVKVIWADRLPDETPYMVFDYVDGIDVRDLIDAQALSLEDAVALAGQVALGLQHLHKNDVYHQDIKPSNLLWTDSGVRILDFNVAVLGRDDWPSGGTRRYIPPDYGYAEEPTTIEKADRDLYALGITIYECITGRYPFNEPMPSLREGPRDPRENPGCETLSPELVKVLLKTIALSRAERFASAEELLEALNEVKQLRAAMHPRVAHISATLPNIMGFISERPNFNPFVSQLLTLYSQSQRSNAGTRGLDTIGEATYVPTLLDEKLRPAILGGDLRLVILSGNAGDGKTAFIQKFERHAERRGAKLHRGSNGAVFKLDGRTFQTNHDGSQDEGEERNDEVLMKFFGLFQGGDEDSWPENQTRIIAINEGRLVDFFMEHKSVFPRLSVVIQDGLAGAPPSHGIAVINLNLRAVVSDPHGGNDSIFERLIRRMTQEEYWQACETCDLKERCYVHHNARSFMDPIAGPKVIERLKRLYMSTHLRGLLHITLRDLRSALAYMLAGTLDCDGIHSLYNSGNQNGSHIILDGFYFNAWMSGASVSGDRLIRLLRELDIGQTNSPDLDRIFGFLEPTAKEMRRFSFTARGSYDDALLKKYFTSLPREHSEKTAPERVAAYQNYVSMVRRRYYFERRDKGWTGMLPYRNVDRFLNLVILREGDEAAEVNPLILAINRGEGLSDPSRLGNKLVLRVRQVDKGTVRSYRLFGGECFSLAPLTTNGDGSFVEYLPQRVLLRYESPTGHHAEMGINLDVYEMLMRLNEGYRPCVEELEGYYLSLSVFKNVLASAPYQEVLLTETGYDFYRIHRDLKGVLHLEKVQGGA